LEDVYSGHVFVGIESYHVLSMIYQSYGNMEEARGIAEKATAFAMERLSSYAVVCSRAFEAELAILQGRFQEAATWARQFNPDPFRSIVWFHFPQLTLAKVLLAENTSKSREKASDLLNRLSIFVKKIHNTRFLIDVLALQALLLDARGKKKDSMEKLVEALCLAEPGGFVRNFLDMGLPMANLLGRLDKKNNNREYIQQILEAFKIDQKKAISDGSAVQSFSSRTEVLQPLIEPLTNRELDIMDLIEQRLQNKEIADKLFISIETVKAHLKNIYQKLNVRNRRQAVEESKKLGII
jgi:LuxR family maltose regulon positive regulatory protein